MPCMSEGHQGPAVEIEGVCTRPYQRLQATGDYCYGIQTEAKRLQSGGRASTRQQDVTPTPDDHQVHTASGAHVTGPNEDP